MGKRERIRELYEKARRKPANLRFNEACALAEGVGFRLDRVRGSHHIFVHDSHKILLNFQKVKGEAKAYQVKQLLKYIEEFQLLP
jgi:predicted RNA binding protein YcfA (HicA-like mRNA interferase family)